METRKEREGSFVMSMAVISAAIAVLLVGVVLLKLDPHIPLLFSIVVILLYGAYLKIPWDEMRGQIIKSISESIEAILIICLIGMTVGSWVSSGIVPMVIYYGLQIFSPKWFLVSVLILCSVMSMMTGSSWTTVGTVGVAFMGVGYGLQIPAGITAGAVVCGAFFGDKQSPMSDATNFASAVSRTDLYRHVKSMAFTNEPAWLVSLVVFLILGLRYSQTSADTEQIQLIMQGLDKTFQFSVILLIPLILLITLIIKKFPAIPTMIVAAISGMVFTVLFQGASLRDALTYMHTGYVGNTGIEVVDQLLTRGGMTSMTSTIMLMLLSLTLAGTLERTKIMYNITQKISHLIQNRFGLVSTTLFLALALNFFAADPYLAMLLPANAFGDSYDEQGIDRCVLSRTLEDGSVTFCPMVPWGTSGIYCADTLGVAVLQYAPYYVLGYATVVIALICAATGIGIMSAKSVSKG